jgi:hypothetical protein
MQTAPALLCIIMLSGTTFYMAANERLKSDASSGTLAHLSTDFTG